MMKRQDIDLCYQTSNIVKVEVMQVKGNHYPFGNLLPSLKLDLAHREDGTKMTCSCSVYAFAVTQANEKRNEPILTLLFPFRTYQTRIVNFAGTVAMRSRSTRTQHVVDRGMLEIAIAHLTRIITVTRLQVFDSSYSKSACVPWQTYLR